MKKFLKKKFLGIPIIAVMLVVLVATVALAAYIVTDLTSTGQITTTAAPVETYSVDTTVLAFGNSSYVEGAAISETADIVVTNTGNQTITGITVVCSSVPSGLTATPTVVGLPCAPAGSATVTVTLTGTAPAPTVIDLTAITATLTPN